MAKNFLYWVIVAGAQPTAFKSRRSEDLLPTLRQLQRTQPNVTMKWFERGRFWDSPEAAREAQLARRREATGRPREWRPGGLHKDPRARFEVPRDERRARFKKRLESGRRPAVPGAPASRPPSSRPQSSGPPGSRPPRRPFRPKPQGRNRNPK